MNEGTLRLNAIDRWEIVHDDGTILKSLSCGDVIQVHIGGHWIETRIEHDRAYYAVLPGVQLCKGLRARSVQKAAP
jgi:Domain of unknown function (DUF5348)